MTYAISPGTTTINEGAGTVTFTITRSSASSAETLFVSTTPDQGFSNSGDYSGLLNLPVSFAIGETSHTVTIAITDDKLVESNETFGIIVQTNASDPASTYLAKSTFTIQDNDQPTTFTPIALTVYAATGVNSIGQGNRDNDDSHVPNSPRQWAYDFLVRNLTNVHAVAAGTVVAVRQDMTGAFRGYGNVVTVLLDGGVYVTYGHLAAYSASVAVGVVQPVQRSIRRPGRAKRSRGRT